METYKDSFFLNVEQAYKEAEKQNIIVDKDGKHRLQYCYYDGPLTDIPLKNFIQIFPEDFINFFSNNLLPFPELIVNEDGSISELKKTSPDVWNEIEQNRSRNEITKSPHVDTYFIDALEALNTAKQQNQVNINNGAFTGIQLCYCHGESLNPKLENLIPVDLDQVIPFFSTTTYRFPVELRLHSEIEDNLKQDIIKSFQDGISEAEDKRQQRYENETAIIKRLSPDFDDEPIRIFFPVNIETGIVSKKFLELGNKLESYGYKVYFEANKTPKEQPGEIESSKSFIHCKPHIVIQLNQLCFPFLQRDVINILIFDNSFDNFIKINSYSHRSNNYYFSNNDKIISQLETTLINKVYNLTKDRKFAPEFSVLLETIPQFISAAHYQQKQIHSDFIYSNSVELSTDNLSVFLQYKNNFLNGLDTLKTTHTSLHQGCIEFLAANKLTIYAYGDSNQILEELELKKNNLICYSLNYELLNKNLNKIPTFLKETSITLTGLSSGYELLAANKHTENAIGVENYKVPHYIFEPDIEFLILNMVIHDFSPLLRDKRNYLLVHQSPKDYYNLFLDLENQIPAYIIPTRDNTQYDELSKQTNSAFQYQKLKGIQYKNDAESYYAKISEQEWHEKFKPENVSKLRVLGISSLFTSFLQYCMRDLINGFDELGATTYLFLESDEHKRMTQNKIISVINEFKPDLIIIIDHFRHEFPTIPKSIPFVNWIQDMLSNITNNQTELTCNDFTFVFAKKWINLHHSNQIYLEHPVHFLPLGYNDKQYYPTSMDEPMNREIDILVVTHLPDLSFTFYPFFSTNKLEFKLNKFEKAALKAQLITKKQLENIYVYLYEYISKMSLIELSDFCLELSPLDRQNIFRSIIKNHGLEPVQQLIDLFEFQPQTRFALEFFYQMKTRPIKVLIEENPDLEIQLYGKRWDKIPLFRPYSKGIAKNGTFLNELMHRAKICINSSPGTTLHMRAMEIIASGSFMLSRNVSNDSSPILDFFEEGSEVILYEDENDLVKKVKHYLINENERKNISEKALIKLDKHFNYKNISRKIIDTINKQQSGQLQSPSL